MKMRAKMVVIALGFAITAWIYAQPKPVYTTVVIDYVGKTDKPVFPIIISSSVEEAERYKQKEFSDPVSTFAHVYIVRESTLKEISTVLLSNIDPKRRNSDAGPRTSPALRLVLAAGHDSREVTVEVAESASLLREIKKRASEYPPLIEQLSDFEGRMNRYLKQSQ